ncbi:MAG: DUF3795 domain-containing protein [Candidatus Lokiarchaeota archaeon]|nr:DUF3795 domain-containing protein [Candidatus Lokiarchaeota archaeon]MBD3202464.1 DUF3795 domain-containing protein [Candidatus Lokiarchaeota archaeon]
MVNKIKKENNSLELLTYCGLYCGACPSYHRETCLGCRSDDHNQKRTSKWGCKIRDCCIDIKEVLYCGQCSDFPCKIISKKLIDSHPNDQRFYYRHKIPKNMKEISNLGVSQWVLKQRNKWECKTCGEGVVSFYNYECSSCGKEYNSDNKTEVN